MPFTGSTVASHADVLRGSSRVPAPRGAGTRDEPLRTSAGEARSTIDCSASLFVIDSPKQDQEM